MRPLARLAAEPLVQFLLIGALVVAATAYFGRGALPPAPAAETIRVDADRIAQLRTLVARSWQREPTADELDRVIEAYVREEIFAREARKLGLDEDDSIIRQRLAQKMEFLFEPPPGSLTPTDAELTNHLEENIARYREEPRIAFTQVFLSPDEHGAALAEDAAAIRAALENGADPAALADPTKLPATVAETAIGNVRRVFGPDFTRTLMDLPENAWEGPVTSPFGAHLVRVTARQTPPEPTLETVREAVERDYLLERRQAEIDDRYAELRATYDVVIDEVPAPEGAQ